MKLIRPYMGKRRGERIDELIKLNDERHCAAAVPRPARQAAMAYLEGEGTLRVVGSRHGVSHVAVLHQLKALRGP
jgi:hypothetical protein